MLVINLQLYKILVSLPSLTNHTHHFGFILLYLEQKITISYLLCLISAQGIFRYQNQIKLLQGVNKLKLKLLVFWHILICLLIQFQVGIILIRMKSLNKPFKICLLCFIFQTMQLCFLSVLVLLRFLIDQLRVHFIQKKRSPIISILFVRVKLSWKFVKTRFDFTSKFFNNRK